MTLIIIDDCPLNLAILKRLSSSKGARDVVAFSDPLKALEHLAENIAEIIIVDHSMEGLDGLEVVRRLRAGGPNQHTPIVMVTGSEEPGMRAQALDAGVQDFLEKPIDVAQFKTVLSGLLENGGWPYVDRRERDGEPPQVERRLA
jgi:putative two-component system response regulator